MAASVRREERTAKSLPDGIHREKPAQKTGRRERHPADSGQGRLFAVVGMLNQSDIALDDLLGYIVSGEIVFYGVVFSLCADMMCGFVQQITLAGTDFTHRPIITADIIFCGELTVCVCCLTRKMQKSDKQSAKLLTCKMQKRPFKE